MECPRDINRLFRERRWTDGFPIVPPTARRVERMLRCTHRNADEVIAAVAPAFGAATVKRIAINAVMAGCDPEYLPVLIAAVEAVAPPQFNLQGIQTTTNPVAVWLILCPEHAAILKAAGLSKAEVKRRLWEQSKMPARRLPAKDLERIQSIRRAELGTLLPDTMLPIATAPEHIGIIVAGGSGTHSLYVPSLGSTRSVTREIMATRKTTDTV